MPEPTILADAPIAPADTSVVTLDSFNPDAPDVSEATNIAPVNPETETPPADKEDRSESATPEEVPPPEKEGEPPEAKPSEPAKAKRDYSKYPDDIHGKLKQMSNAAFEVFEKTFAERASLEAKVKELEGKSQDPNKLPEQWHEHEDAYLLSPEFRENSAALSRVQRESSFVSAQLAAIERGEKFFVPGWGQNGELVPCVVSNGALMPSREGMEPTAEAKATLLEALTTAASQKQQLNGKIASLREKFVNEHKQARESVEAGIKANAPWSDKPDDPLTKWANTFIEKAVPKTYQKHPLAKAAAHAYAYALSEKQGREKLEAEVKALKGLKEDARRAPPLPSGRKTVATPAPTTFTLEKMRELESFES